MIVSIMQPAYLPWLGYFDRIAASDMHVVLDHVAMDCSSKNKFANRNRIRTQQGWCWLTVPLDTKTLHNPIMDIQIASDRPWRKKHWSSMRFSYTNAPYFLNYLSFFEDFFTERYTLLTQATEISTKYLMDCLGISVPTIRSSDLGIRSKGTELILDICREVGASTYISGPFGRNYLNEQSFRNAAIELVYHSYVYPVYTQVYPGFEPYMSAVDFLFSHGALAKDKLVAGRRFEN